MKIEVCYKLSEYRKKLGLSQEDLAEKIGVTRQAVSKWERGESSPDTDNLIALSRIFNISIDEMLAENKENIKLIDIQQDDDCKSSEKHKSKWRVLPFPILVFIIFIILLNVIEFKWAWLVFLLIPIWGYLIRKT